jgi:6-phosphogluconolactonase
MRPGAPLLRRYPDPDTQAQAFAGDIAGRLRRAIRARGAASLLVPGGRTPAAFFEHLARAQLDWSRITIGLTDERWVPPTDEASNEHLLRQHLLREHAAQARFIGLWNDAPDAASAAAQAWRNLQAVARPFDAVVLGMGEDGHFASLFPNDGASTQALQPDAEPACVVTGAPTLPAQRLSLNLAALLQTRALYLLIIGEQKWQLVMRTLQATPLRTLPVDALLDQNRTALTVLWAPA